MERGRRLGKRIIEREDYFKLGYKEERKRKRKVRKEYHY